MNEKTLAIFCSIFLILIGTAIAYSTYGAPSEFGNATDTTCYVGGDIGIINCTGEIIGSKITIDGIIVNGTLYLRNGSDVWHQRGNFTNDLFVTDEVKIFNNGSFYTYGESISQYSIMEWDKILKAGRFRTSGPLYLYPTTGDVIIGQVLANLIPQYGPFSWFVSNLGNSSNPWNTVFALNLTGNLSWPFLDNYPVACPAGSAITQLGDSVICTSFLYSSDEIYINKLSNNFTMNETKLNATIQAIKVNNATNADKLTGLTPDIFINGNCSSEGSCGLVQYRTGAFTSTNWSNQLTASNIGNWTNDKTSLPNLSYSNIATAVGNWTLDKPSYQTKADTATNISAHQNTFKHGNTTDEIWRAIGNPTYKLDVNGTTRMTNNGNQRTLDLFNNAGYEILQIDTGTSALTGYPLVIKSSKTGATGAGFDFTFLTANTAPDLTLHSITSSSNQIGSIRMKNGSATQLEFGQVFDNNPFFQTYKNLQIGIDTGNKGAGDFEIAKNGGAGRTGVDGTSLFYLKNNGYIGLNDTTPSYPLDINLAKNGISIYTSGNISATGYITRTEIYDKSKGSALDFSKDAGEYKNPDGSINHSAFGYSKVIYDKQIVIGYNISEEYRLNCSEPKRAETECYTNCSIPKQNGIQKCNEVCIEIKPAIPEICNNASYPKKVPILKTIKEEGVSLDKEISLLKQQVFELKGKVNSHEFCLGKLCVGIK